MFVQVLKILVITLFMRRSFSRASGVESTNLVRVLELSISR